MASIEATASSSRKTKESIRTSSLIPEGVRENSQNLIKLLEDYYEYMNNGFNPSYELNTITEEIDIDRSQHYLTQIQKEIASVIPKTLQSDKVNLYKNLSKFYNLRGSSESIDLFFKIILNDNVEVRYPKNDMLIPSDGKWSKQRKEYVTTDGHLSDKNKLQDSYFYQKFSYLIRTGNNIELWEDTFRKLVHPAGFIFFGEIALFLYLLNDKAKMPLFQPGLIGREDLDLIVEIFANIGNIGFSVAEVLPTLVLVFSAVSDWKLRRQIYFTKLLKFYDASRSDTYGEYTVNQGINSLIDRNNVGVEITLSA